MKKKKIVGHMMAPEESVVSRVRRWQILPRLWCLILALLIWLAVVNLNSAEADKERGQNDPPAVSTEA